MEKDLDTARRIHAAFIGAVKVRQLNNIIFEDIDIIGSRAYNQSEIDHLLHRFELEGCRRLDPLTWIPCAMKVQDLPSSLTENLRPDDPEHITLPEGSKIHCYQGRHRVAAALQWLPPSDVWWVFNIYDLEKLNEDCKLKLRDASRTFSDGEIFRYTRHYQKQGATKPANEWFARWTLTKCREFRRIYEPKAKQAEFRDLAQHLDQLLCFPALWISWHMGTHLPSLNCPEELTNALKDIYQTWQALTCQTPHILDTETLKLLEGRCPRLSTADRRYICEVFENGLAFPMAHDPAVRSRLLASALDFPTVIPSLRTFFENAKYLKAMTDAVKTILPKSSKGTIRQTLHRFYVAPQGPRFKVQYSENAFKEIQRPEKYGFWSAYRQVFLFAMRHFCGLTEARPLGFSQASRTRCLERSELQQRFRFMISSLGFSLPGRQYVPQVQSNDSIAIRSLVTRLRPHESFVYTESDISEYTARVASILSSIKPRNVEVEVPAHSCDKFEDWSLQQRCGMTDTDTFFSDRKYLFLENIYSTDQFARENMTSFAVKRNTFRFFFSYFDGSDDMGGVAGDESVADRDGDEDMCGRHTETEESMGVADRDGDEDMCGQDSETEENMGVADRDDDENMCGRDTETEKSMVVHTIAQVQQPFPSWIRILSKSNQLCLCKLELLPADLYDSIIEYDYKMVIYYDMGRQEAIFTRHDLAPLAIRLIENNGKPVENPISENNGNRWWSIIEPDGDGYSATPVNLPDIFSHPRSKARDLLFVCHSEIGNDFTSHMRPTLGKVDLQLPFFEKNDWILKDLELEL